MELSRNGHRKYMYICSSLLRKPVVNGKLKSPFRYEFGFVANETKFLLNEFGLDKKFKDKDKDNHR